MHQFLLIVSEMWSSIFARVIVVAMLWISLIVLSHADCKQPFSNVRSKAQRNIYNKKLSQLFTVLL